jgi:hypothetical protein
MLPNVGIAPNCDTVPADVAGELEPIRSGVYAVGGGEILFIGYAPTLGGGDVGGECE